jgi:hypothetical protein
MLKFTPVSLLLLLPILAACGAPDVRFPSLERRNYETDAPISAPVDVAAAPIQLSAELAAKVGALQARHKAAQASFARALPPVQATAANAARTPPGSESWVNAHLQLSRLDKMRADSVAALRDFDVLITQEGPANVGLAELLTEAQQPVADDVAAQNAEIERLSRLIGE